MNSTPRKAKAGKKIPLVEVRQALLDNSPAVTKQLGRQVDALEIPPQRFIHGAVLDGVLPAIREKGRWYIFEDDLPEIARTLCVIPQRKPGRPRKASPLSHNSGAAVAA